MTTLGLRLDYPFRRQEHMCIRGRRKAGEMTPERQKKGGGKGKRLTPLGLRTGEEMKTE